MRSKDGLAPTPVKPVQDFSPFEAVFAPFSGKIPFAFKEQFLHSPENPYWIEMYGALDIWFRPGWLYPLFWVMEKAGILISETGRQVPTRVVVRAAYDHNGRPVHYWDRTFQFKTDRHFNTVLPYDVQHEEVGDYVGKGKFVYLIWAARYHPPLTFTLDTKMCAFHIGNRFFWLPRAVWEILLGRVHCVQVAHDQTGTVFDLDLVIRHPWFGEVFGYRGTFRTQRVDDDIPK